MVELAASLPRAQGSGKSTLFTLYFLFSFSITMQNLLAELRAFPAPIAAAWTDRQTDRKIDWFTFDFLFCEFWQPQH